MGKLTWNRTQELWLKVVENVCGEVQVQQALDLTEKMGINTWIVYTLMKF